MLIFPNIDFSFQVLISVNVYLFELQTSKYFWWFHACECYTYRLVWLFYGNLAGLLLYMYIFNGLRGLVSYLKCCISRPCHMFNFIKGIKELYKRNSLHKKEITKKTYLWKDQEGFIWFSFMLDLPESFPECFILA